jgi:hypothetical protein
MRFDWQAALKQPPVLENLFVWEGSRNVGRRDDELDPGRAWGLQLAVDLIGEEQVAWEQGRSETLPAVGPVPDALVRREEDFKAFALRQSGNGSLVMGARVDNKPAAIRPWL